MRYKTMLGKIKYSGEDLYPYERTAVEYQPKKEKITYKTIDGKEKVAFKTIESSEGVAKLKDSEVPIYMKYALTIKEATAYFGIGERKLRKLIDSNEFADWFFMNGTKILIKRKQFEKYLDEASYI